MFVHLKGRNGATPRNWEATGTSMFKQATLPTRCHLVDAPPRFGTRIQLVSERGFWIVLERGSSVGFWGVVSGEWFLGSGFWRVVSGKWFLARGFWAVVVGKLQKPAFVEGASGVVFGERSE